MPELPEVETTCAGIRPHLLGHKVKECQVRESRLRWPVSRGLFKHLNDQKLNAVERRAKYILLKFESGTLIIHLGMSGSLRVLPHDEKPQKHDHIDWVFSNKQLLRFNDPRRFGAVLWHQGPVGEHKLLAHLGPEPLSDDFHGEHLFLKSRKKATSVKQFIMDGQIVVGVGNIYANEALFAAGIDPRRKAGSVSRVRYQRLSEEIKSVLAKAIKQGGTTLKDFQDPEGKPGYFVQELKVYGRKGEPCLVCERRLKEVRMNSRSTVFCTNCQK